MSPTLSPLLALIDAYAAKTGASDTTISARVFNDGKKVTVLRNGGDITTQRLDNALRWFSDNWPDDTRWPVGVARPVRTRNGEVAA